MWCELLSQALAAIWSSSVAVDPNPWLKWDPQKLTEQPSSRKHHGKIENRVSDQYRLSRMWVLKAGLMHVPGVFFRGQLC